MSRTVFPKEEKYLLENPRIISQKETDAGLSAFSCPDCGAYAELSEEGKMSHEDNPKSDDVFCMECYSELSLDECNISVLEEDAPFLISDEIPKTSWFHVTTRKNWLDDVCEDHIARPFVHIGTNKSAVSRAEEYYFGGQSDEGNDPPEFVYLYELKIKDSTSIDEEFIEDTNQWPPYVNFGANYGVEHPITRYLNRWEVPGAISLLVDPTCLEMVRRTKIRNPDKIRKDKA